MDRTSDAASFTGETLAWFDEGEQLAASERAAVAEQPAARRRFVRALGVLFALAIAGFAGVLVARHFGLTIELPVDLRLPWE
jgi:hypothetical protein